MPPKSDVWKHFSKNTNNMASCNVCKKNIKSSGNTTNLIGHLKARHRAIYTKYFNTSTANSAPRTPVATSIISVESDEMPSTSTASASTSTQQPLELTGIARQQSLDRCFKSISAFKNGGDKYNRVTTAILYMICRDSQPISIVEDEGFKYLLKVTAPLYKAPSRRTIDTLLNSKYEYVASLVKSELEKVSCVCLTTDIWTETHRTKRFLGITAHFISDSFIEPTTDLQLQNVTIGAFELTERHTGEHLAHELTTKCMEWNIKKDHVITVVTDGGANMIKAVETAFGKKHTYCFAHLLNLLAQKTINFLGDGKEVVEKVKSIVTWFKRSVVGSDELRKKTEGLEARVLIQSVETRWNSTFYMLERFMLLRETVTTIITFNATAPAMVTASEAEMLNDLILLFQPIERATKEISGEKFVTASIVIPVLRIMKKKIFEAVVTTTFGRITKDTLKQQFTKRFGGIESNALFSIATLLDPRFKNLHFEDSVALASAIKRLSRELKIHEESSSESDGHSSYTNSPGKPAPSDFNFWDEHHKLVQENWKAKKRSRVIDQMDTAQMPPELAVYLKSPVSRLNEDPMEVWQQGYVPKDSTLMKTAIKYLSIMATSVPSERVFSAAGNIASSRRSCISGEKLQKILFLQTVNSKFWNLE